MSRVYMLSPKGDEADFVDAREVPRYLRAGFTAPDVRMTMANGNQYPVHAARVEHWLNQGAELVMPGQEQPTPSLGESERGILRDAAGSTAHMAMASAPIMVPGVGAIPLAARTALGFAGGMGGDIAERKIRGLPQDYQQSAMSGGVNAALGIPFELAGMYLPPRAPGMSANALKPSKSQQIAAENVARRANPNAPQAAAPDYERLGRQMLHEGVGVTARGGQRAVDVIRARNEADTNDLQAALTGANGVQVHAASLVRSPEVMELRTQIRRETNGDEVNSRLTSMLRRFMRQRTLATPGTPARQSTVVNAQGNTTTIPGTPAQSIPMNPEQLRLRQRTMREVSDPVLASRNRGESVQPDIALEARMNDALARAARRITHTLVPATEPLDAALEARIPLEEALSDFARRPPMTAMESVRRVMSGHMTPGIEANQALNLNDPTFPARSRMIARLLGLGSAQFLGPGQQSNASAP